MKAFLAAVAVAVVLGGGAFMMLNNVQKPVETAFSTQGVRL